MTKRVDNYFDDKYSKDFTDIDTEELMRLFEAGYKTEDIARELSVSREQIHMLKNEIDKYY